jgi:rare lipoprotein A
MDAGGVLFPRCRPGIGRRYRTMRTMIACHPAAPGRAVLLLCALLAASALAGEAPPAAPGAPAAPRAIPGAPARPDQGGLASITRDRLEGFTTASGEPYSRNGFTAGHRSLPFGTLVRVTNLENRRTVVVRINDRSSAVGTRIIDLTPRAAAVIGLQGIATVPVKLEVIGASAARLMPPAGDASVK